MVNPLFSHFVLYRDIVRVDDTSSLVLVTNSGDEVSAVAFGGSVIDHFVGSTSRASERVRERVKRARKVSGLNSSRTITRSWIADACILGSLVCGAMSGATG